MARKDKKNRTSEYCGHPCTISQKLCEHLNRKNPCRPLISPVLLPQHQRTLTISRNLEILDIAEVIQNLEPLPEQNSKILLKNLSQELYYENYKQPRTLRACQVLYDTLLQIDEKAYDNIELTKQTKVEQEFFGEPEIERQVIDSSKAGL
ncbi:2059_t:CDS:2, partial [Racocetra persica]